MDTNNALLNLVLLIVLAIVFLHAPIVAGCIIVLYIALTLVAEIIALIPKCVIEAAKLIAGLSLIGLVIYSAIS